MSERQAQHLTVFLFFGNLCWQLLFLLHCFTDGVFVTKIQLESSPICHLALEKSITDLNKGDLRNEFQFLILSFCYLLQFSS